MPRGGAHFTPEELACVLSNYDIGLIRQIESLNAGNTRAPKKTVISDKGKFLLKRRQKGKNDIYHVAFAHAIQTRLQEKDFPVTKIVTTRDNNSILYLEDHIYELFHFVSGTRYQGLPAETAEAGQKLAQFHNAIADFDCDWKPLRRTFHDCTGVREHLKTIGRNASKANPACELHKIADKLLCQYNRSGDIVNRLGFGAWPEQIVHGDWHPGNMLFSQKKIAAVLDFDSVKIASPVTDLANGLLQFSIVGARPNPKDWPEYLDEKKLADFVKGYKEIITPGKNMLSSLPDQMIETMIAEAVLPVAATGFFGHLEGADFLSMIQRKCNWIDKNRETLTKILLT